MQMLNNTTNAIIFDLDNTLYDWVYYFVHSFEAMVNELTLITGIEKDILLDDFRTVHQKHHNSEHPFAVLELECLGKRYQGLSYREVAEKIDAALYAFNKTRKETLKCYPRVISTLEELRLRGISLVAHTDSDMHAVIDRLSRLGIEHYFQAIYCREAGETLHPNVELVSDWETKFPMHKVNVLPRDCLKPAPIVLERICEEQNINKVNLIYVGDSMSKDILMAQKAGIRSAWAKFGSNIHAELYEKLVRVSHWNTEDIQREKTLSIQSQNITPDIILKSSLDEILTYL